MRATMGRAAVVLLLSLSVVGCKSSSNMFAFGRGKKSDLSEAPKYASATNPALPSASALGSPGTAPAPGAMAAAVTASTPSNNSLGNIGAMSAASQTTYPKTPFDQAKLGGAPAGTTGTPVGTSGVNVSGFGSAGYGAQAATTTTPSYGTPASYGAPAGTAAATPALAAAQPQTGGYGSSYAAAPPAAQASYAAAPPAAAYTAAPAASTTPDYRTADARSSLGAGIPAPTTPAAGNVVGDRYASAALPQANPGYIDSAPPAAAAAVPSYRQPPNAAAAGTVGDRYAQPAADPAAYVPGATGYQPGNTGYNPPDVYSVPAATPAAAPAADRQDSGYRPGGTSNFVPPAGAATKPASAQPMSGVKPASFQSAETASPSQTWPAVSTAAAANSGESYGSYQGSSSTSEPAYGAGNPMASAPGLFPTR